MKPLITVPLLCLLSLSNAAPKKPEFWRGTALDSAVEKMRLSCEQNNGFACLQFKAFNFLDNMLQGGYFQLFTNKVHMTRNGYENEIDYKRSNSDSIEESLEYFVKSTDISVDVPEVGKVAISARNFDKNEVDVNVNFGNDEDSGTEERSKKHKLKKVFLPLASFLLLKAITVVPFIIGLLGIKAFNGLQLSIFSFIIAAGMTIYTVCQKLVENSAHQHPVIVEPFPHRQKRELSYGDSQKLAYSAYT